MEMTVALALKTMKLVKAYSYTSAVLIAVAYFFMGATIDLEIVTGIIKQPVGPAVGVFCQYVMMPVVSTALARGEGEEREERRRT